MLDHQQKKVYDAEWRMSVYKRPRFYSANAAETFVNRLIGTNWFMRNFPHLKYRPVAIFETKGKSAVSYTVSNEIDLPKWAQTKLVLCHELAHLCNDKSEAFQVRRNIFGFGRRKKRGLASHGPRFCEIYLKLVRRILGDEKAQELRHWFNLYGVKYEGRKRQRFVFVAKTTAAT